MSVSFATGNIDIPVSLFLIKMTTVVSFRMASLSFLTLSFDSSPVIKLDRTARSILTVVDFFLAATSSRQLTSFSMKAPGYVL